jgi:hypothetical protein
MEMKPAWNNIILKYAEIKGLSLRSLNIISIVKCNFNTRKKNKHLNDENVS